MITILSLIGLALGFFLVIAGLWDGKARKLLMKVQKYLGFSDEQVFFLQRYCYC